MVLRVEHSPISKWTHLRPGSDGLFQVTFFDTILNIFFTSEKNINLSMQHYHNCMLVGPTVTIIRPAAENTSGGIELDIDNTDIAELCEQLECDELGKYGKLTLSQRILCYGAF